MCRSGNRRGVQHQRVCQGQAGEYCGHSQCQVEEWVCPREPTAGFWSTNCSWGNPRPKPNSGRRSRSKDPSSSPGATFQVPALLLRGAPGVRAEKREVAGAWLPALNLDSFCTCLQGHTDILVGVKAEMGVPRLDKPNEGYLEFFVDWSVLHRCF